MAVRTNLSLGLITILLVLPVVVTQSHHLPARAPGARDDDSYTKAIEKWQSERIEEINGEDGWTTLVGLFWLKDGENKFGSAPSNDIVLPRGTAPGFSGSFRLDNGVVSLIAKPEAGITNDGQPVTTLILRSDSEGKPTVLKMGSLKLLVIKRAEKLGLRVKDKNHPARSNFRGLQRFPLRPDFRINARFDPYNPPKIIPILNVLDMIDHMISPGALIFSVDGRSYRLDPVLEKGSRQLFIIFADKTSGKETYGGGRYLYADPPGPEGSVVLDFNKAHNPPCAFTKFATCPLPPRQNRLALRVEAGEKKYSGPGH
jgi:uncharacterized protein (DUF1684 family)